MTKKQRAALAKLKAAEKLMTEAGFSVVRAALTCGKDGILHGHTFLNIIGNPEHNAHAVLLEAQRGVLNAWSEAVAKADAAEKEAPGG